MLPDTRQDVGQFQRTETGMQQTIIVFDRTVGRVTAIGKRNYVLCALSAVSGDAVATSGRLYLLCPVSDTELQTADSQKIKYHLCRAI